MPAIIFSILIKLQAWSQRLIIGVTINVWNEATKAVKETDDASAARKDAAGKAQLRVDATCMPDLIVRRLIQGAHLYSRLKAPQASLATSRSSTCPVNLKLLILCPDFYANSPQH